MPVRNARVSGSFADDSRNVCVSVCPVADSLFQDARRRTVRSLHPYIHLQLHGLRLRHSDDGLWADFCYLPAKTAERFSKVEKMETFPAESVVFRVPMIQEARGIFMLRAFFRAIAIFSEKRGQDELLQNWNDRYPFCAIGLCRRDGEKIGHRVFFSDGNDTDSRSRNPEKYGFGHVGTCACLSVSFDLRQYDRTCQARTGIGKMAKAFPCEEELGEIRHGISRLSYYVRNIRSADLRLSGFQRPGREGSGPVLHLWERRTKKQRGGTEETCARREGDKALRDCAQANFEGSGRSFRFLYSISAEENETMVGAYSEERNLTPEDLDVFEKATADYAYLNLSPKSVMSQVVAGTNYVFLCEMKGPDGIPAEARVLIFAPLPGQGSPEMIRVDR